MKWVREHCHIIDHPRFLAAGALARDLWEWGMKYVGKHETDAEITTEAVLASPWGAGGRGNAKLATKLVDVGLWERTDLGFRVLKWTEMGNPTKAELEEARKFERDGRKARRRGKPASAPLVSAPDIEPCPPRTPDGVPNSYSHSDSESRSPEPEQGEIASDTSTPPPWFATALDVIEMNVGERLHAGTAWLRYRGHRSKKGEPMSQHDAEYWLTTVMVKENKSERDEAHRRNERDGERTKAIVRERHGPEVKPLPSVAPLIREREKWAQEAATPQQSAEAAANLRKLLGGVGR